MIFIFLNFFLIQCVSLVYCEIVLTELAKNNFEGVPFKNMKSRDYFEETPSCNQLSHNIYSPFVVLLIFQTSGHFLGMGSIIDRRTVLTASQAVDMVLNKPSKLYVVAGRMSPWWGKNAQVKQAKEILSNQHHIALVVLKEEFNFVKNVQPIELAIDLKYGENFTDIYTGNWGVFGVPRSYWDLPGDATSKTIRYLMKFESVTNQIDDCQREQPDISLNDTYMGCTFANGSFCWGCLGSPTVSMNGNNEIKQIGVLIKAPTREEDIFHIHIVLHHFRLWLKSHSLAGYKTTFS